MSHPAIASVTTIAILALGPVALGQPKSSRPSGVAPLARTEFIADMDREFRKMDADKNGQLTKAEIEQYQNAQAMAQAAARNQALFAQLDTNKNGQLSRAEFAKIATPAAAANAQPMLARMDGDHDDQVSRVEHRTATLANFDRLDADKDGYVTPAEMQAGGITPR